MSQYAGLPEGAVPVPETPAVPPVVTRDVLAAAPAALVELRARHLLPLSVERAARRVAALKRLYTTAAAAAARETHEAAVAQYVRRLRRTKVVRNVKMNAADVSDAMPGRLCMPFSTCAAVPPAVAHSLGGCEAGGQRDGDGGGGGGAVGSSSTSASASAEGGMILTGAVDGVVVLWETGGCRALAAASSYPGRQWGRVRSVVAHPAAPLAFSASMFDRAISVWALRGGDEDGGDGDNEEAPRAHQLTVVARTAGGGGGGEADSGAHTATINALAVDAGGGALASAGDDATLRLWDVRRCGEGGGPAAPLHALTQGGYERAQSVRGVAFHPDGALLSTADAGGRVVAWDLRSGRVALSTAVAGNTVAGGGGHLGAARCVAWSPCGWRFASGGDDHVVHLWDARRLHAAANNNSNSDSGGAKTGGGRLARFSACAPVATLLGHEDAVTSVSFLPNPLVPAAPQDDEAGGGAEEWGQGGLRLLPAAVLATSLDGTARLWDADTGLVARVLGCGAPVYQHCRAGATAVVTVGHAKQWTVWDVAEGSAVLETRATGVMAAGGRGLARGHHRRRANSHAHNNDDSSEDDEEEKPGGAVEGTRAAGGSDSSSDSDSDDEMQALRQRKEQQQQQQQTPSNAANASSSEDDSDDDEMQALRRQ